MVANPGLSHGWRTPSTLDHYYCLSGSLISGVGIGSGVVAQASYSVMGSGHPKAPLLPLYPCPGYTVKCEIYVNMEEKSLKTVEVQTVLFTLSGTLAHSLRLLYLSFLVYKMERAIPTARAAGKVG